MGRGIVAVLLLGLVWQGLCWGGEGLQFQDVAFVAQCDKTEQRYVLGLPRDFLQTEPHDVLIALHGHGSDRWQFVKDLRDECRAAREVADEHRLIFVSPDYRAKTSWMGPKAEADVLQMIEELGQRFRISRVFVCGGSMGGTAALTLAARHPDRIAGVVSMNGTANHLEYEGFQEAIGRSFGGSKAEIPEEYKNRSAEYWPERLTMPIGITACGQDRVVPPESVLRLAKVLKRIGRPVHVVFRDKEGHRTNYEDARSVLEFVLQRASTGPP